MSLQQINGDLLDYTGEGVYLCHQANCLRTGDSGAGLAKEIFIHYPCADTYLERTAPSIPGTNDIFKDTKSKTTIINMYGQNSWKPHAEDPITRERWFKQCLDSIDIPAGSKIYFPKGIGCGLARGKWLNYEKMIRDWATVHPDLFVFIIAKEMPQMKKG